MAPGFKQGRGPAMRKPIDIDVVEARLRDLGQTSVSETVSLFKGGTFALAAVLLLEIVSAQQGWTLRLTLWGVSFLITMTSYNAHLNTSIVDFRETVAGVVIIIVQMMTELMLFVVLTPRFELQMWHLWSFVYAGFMFVTALRLRLFRPNDGLTIDPALEPLFAAVQEGRRLGTRRTFINAVFAFGVGMAILLLPKDSPWPVWLMLALGLIAAGQAIFGLFFMHRQRALMERMIDEALTATAAD
jgi:hypothetical protein